MIYRFAHVVQCMYEKEDVANLLLDTGTISFNLKRPFQRGSGYMMPVDEQAGRIVGRPYKELNSVAETLCSFLYDHHINYDIVAGTIQSLPFATMVSRIEKKPLIYFVPQSGHRHMNGEPVDRKEVLVVEFVVYSGRSEAILIEDIRKKRGIVKHCAALLDYNFPETPKIFSGEIPYDGDRKLSQPCSIDSVLDFKYLVDIAVSEKGYTAEDAAGLMEWRSDRFNWGEKHGFPKKRIISSRS